MTADEQEALSFAYVVQQKVVRLKSGLYAIFGHYDYSAGRLPLLHIAPWAECETFVTEYVFKEKPAEVSAKAKLLLDLTEIDL